MQFEDLRGKIIKRCAKQIKLFFRGGGGVYVASDDVDNAKNGDVADKKRQC